MRFDSIKSRLMLMTLICVVGMTLLVLNQHIFTKQLFKLHEQHNLLLHLEQELLQLRRHEKDFLLRHQMDYYHRFTARSQAFSQDLVKLSPLLDAYALPVEQTGVLAQSMDDYQRLFQKVVTLQSQIGLTRQSGLQGKLSGIENSMDRDSFFAYGTQAYQRKVALQLATRNYLLTPEGFYRQTVSQTLEQLRQSAAISNNKTAGALVSEYASNFNELAESIVAMGLTHNEGLRGEFRRQAHDVEDKLNSIETALQPLITAQQQQVRVYSLSIAAVTSLALILLLVKSFATFHHAFANFVMFFYRCKRQYQKIDTRQLGFAEFKSLAELANEMVESRRDMEKKLAKAEAKLEEHNTPAK